MVEMLSAVSAVAAIPKVLMVMVQTPGAEVALGPPDGFALGVRGDR